MVIATQLPVAIAKSYSPGHITGFFATENPDSNTTPLHRGSLGAGFSIDKGIYTTVKIFNSSNKNFDIKLNGITSLDLKVSRYVIEYYLNFINHPVFVSVEHESEIPIGYGLGSSGSAALSLSYALNDVLGTNFTRIQSAQIAHAADIECKTGLGTVISEYMGGFELRFGIGGPGVGKVIKKYMTSDWAAVILCLVPINTNSLLGNTCTTERKKRQLNILGKKMINELIQNSNVTEFLKKSYSFAVEYGLVDGPCKKPLEELRSIGINSSVALFGHTLFTLVKKNELPSILSILRPYGSKVLLCGVDNLGARLLEKTPICLKR